MAGSARAGRGVYPRGGCVSGIKVQCPQCGTALDADARYCVACGAGVPGPSSNVSATGAAKGIKSQLLEHLRDATLGEYEILLELGSGGMATVFLAHDLQLDRRVAIKLMHPTLLAGEDMVERFILEARTAAGLSHPNIIPIHAVKVQEDLLYFVMKFIEGRPLDSIIRAEAPLDADMVRQIVTQVGDALAYAHRHGVIHRDIKPANIIISTDGHPILADFGIAKVADRPGLTMTGATIGTPTYMSPEQCDAEPLTGASDQYSLGVTAFEMLTGRPPFEAPGYMALMMKHMAVPAPPIRSLVPGCPPDLAITIDRMLAKKPEDRFPVMEQVIETLAAVPVASPHTVRTQLVQYALADPNRERVKRVSTPRSPIPTAARRMRSGITSREDRRQVPPWAWGGMLVGAVAMGALLVARPWNQVATSAGPDSARQPAVTPPVASPVLGAADTAPLRPPVAQAPPPAAAPAPTPGRSREPAPGAAEREIFQAVSVIRVVGPAELTTGDSGAVVAEASDSRGQPVSGRSVTWTSNAPAVVSVSGTGQLRARSVGRATITATIEGLSQSFVVTVSPEAVAGVAVAPTAIVLAPGETAAVSARVADARGQLLDRPVEWNSSAPAVASVSAMGRVTAVAPGTAIVSATSGGRLGTTTVTVAAREAPPPSEADRRAQIVALFGAYARALESRDIGRVRQLNPTMSAAAEEQLRNDLPGMEQLQVRLDVGQIQPSEEAAFVHVTGAWTYTSRGRRESLPANNRYRVEQRGTGWVITDIRDIR